MTRIPYPRRSPAFTGSISAILIALVNIFPFHPAHAQQAVDALQKRLTESRTFQEETLNSLHESDRNKLKAGNVVALLEDIPESPVKIGKGIGVLSYPPEVVWQVLNDYANYKHFMPFTKESTVDLSRSGGDVVYFYSELSFPLIDERRYSLKITSEENVEGQPRTFFTSWSLDPEKKSNLYLNSGSWKLVPYGPGGQKTLAFYTVITDPGGSIPNFLKNKSTEVAIPSVFEAITSRAREGLSAKLYRLPLSEDTIDRLLRKNVEDSRTLDRSVMEALSEEEKKALATGDVLVSLSDVEGTWVKIARAVALIEMKPAALWKTITAYDDYEEFVPYVTECTVDPVRSKGNVTFLTYHLHFLVFPYIKDRYFTVKLIEEVRPNGQPDTYFVHWWLDTTKPTNVNRNCGSWKLVPYGEDASKTLVFYTVLADPGGLSPWFWRNISAKKAVHNVIDAIKKRAGKPESAH